MTISEKVAYLKGLAEGLNLDTEKSKEGKLISVMIGILEEIGLSIEDLEENAQALGEEIDVLSDDLADVESEVFGEDEDEDGEDYDDDWFEVECPNCEEPLIIDDKALAHTEAIILSMTPLERENPQILNASRKKRIAAGCGLEVVDVNRLLKQFDMMQQLTKQMTRGRLSKMGGGGLGSRMHGFGRKKRLK